MYDKLLLFFHQGTGMTPPLPLKWLLIKAIIILHVITNGSGLRSTGAGVPNHANTDLTLQFQTKQNGSDGTINFENS